MKKLIKITYLNWFLILSLFIFAGCAQKDEQAESSAKFLQGFAFYPGVFFSNDPQNYVNSYNSEIMLFHFGDKVPWEYLQESADLSSADKEFKETMNILTTHAKYHKGKVYLSISPLNNERNSPATDWNGEPVSAKSFADKDLRMLYNQWVAYLIETFNPDYVSQGIEINMYYNEHPEDFENLLTLMKEVKQNNKNIVGPSIQWEFYKKQIDDGKNLNISFEELGEGFVISTYPHIFDPSSNASVTPEHYDFKRYEIIIDGSLYIAESGIQHHSQESMLETLFSLDNLEVVNWFFKEDSEKFFSQHTGYPYTIFQGSGLYTDTGEKNPGAHLWENSVSK